MAQFTDAEGRTWKVRITLGDLRPLKAVGLDVAAIAKDPAGLQDVVADVERYGQVLWTLCEREAAARSIAPEQFAAGFDGPTLFAAAGAIEEALMDFSQPPTVAKTFAEHRAGAAEKVARAAAKKLERILTGWSDSDGSSPGSPDSTPSPAPSGS